MHTALLTDSQSYSASTHHSHSQPTRNTKKQSASAMADAWPFLVLPPQQQRTALAFREGAGWQAHHPLPASELGKHPDESQDSLLLQLNSASESSYPSPQAAPLMSCRAHRGHLSAAWPGPPTRKPRLAVPQRQQRDSLPLPKRETSDP